MAEASDKPSLFRRIEIPDSNIPRVPRDASEMKTDLLRHMNLSKFPIEAEFKKNRDERRKKRKQESEGKPAD